MTERNDREPGGFTRRSLLAGSAGVATTVAVAAVVPAAGGSRHDPALTKRLLDAANPSTKGTE